MLSNNISNLFNGISPYTKLERAIAIICLFIPLLLILAEQTWVIRESISDYVYMVKNPHVYGILLTIAAMLFLTNGTIYLVESESFIDLFSSKPDREKGKGYNILLGIFLFGVVLFPHNEFKFIHFGCALLFFIGCSVVMWFYDENIPSTVSKILAVVNLVVLIIGLLPSIKLSLFWAEWVCLGIIGFHYLIGIRNPNEWMMSILFKSKQKPAERTLRVNK